MAINKFYTEAIRTDEYTIEIDDEVWNEEAFKDWSSVFWPVSSAKDIAEAVAGCLLRQQPGEFWEGFGHVKTFRSSGTEISHYKAGYVKMNDDELCKGITIYLHYHDEEFEYNIEDVTERGSNG